ncbi:MAG: hypothetical protein N3B21_03600 [Clostridia bacterium]|nr:hypothetical protein [Clostridia bacterium]
MLLRGLINMKNVASFILLISMALTTFSGCGGSEEVSEINKQTAQYLKIVELKKAPNPDIQEIKNIYSNVLSKVVEEADKTSPGLKSDINEYLSLAEKDNVKAPHLQGFEKSMQMAFVNLIRGNLDSISRDYNDTGKALHYANKIKALYEAIKPTAKRREEYIDSKEEFNTKITTLINNLEKEITSKNQEKVAQYIKEIENIINKVYFLSVVYELEGIASNLEKNINIAFEKQVEGRVFFKIIKDSAGNEKLATLIENEFQKSASEINIAALRDNIKRAYPDLSSEYNVKLNTK